MLIVVDVSTAISPEFCDLLGPRRGLFRSAVALKNTASEFYTLPTRFTCAQK